MSTGIGKGTCWWCRKKFMRNVQTDQDIFVVIADPIGNQHKVHKNCSVNVEAEQRGRLVFTSPEKPPNDQ